MPVTNEGLIIGVDYCGWQIIIYDDQDGSTGGYYIYIKNGNQTFDYWFEKKEDLKNQLNEFKVKWIDN